MVSSAPDRPPLAEWIARHDRAVLLGSILLVAALAWGWLAVGAGLGEPGRMDRMAPTDAIRALWRHSSAASAIGAELSEAAVTSAKSTPCPPVALLRQAR